MSKGSRRSLFLFTASMLLLAAAATAQMDCGECDPYTNHCSDPCLKCTMVRIRRRLRGLHGNDLRRQRTAGPLSLGRM